MEALGDAGTLAESGYFRNIFLRGMDRHSSAVQSGDLRIVGVNEHVIAPEDDRFLRDVAEQRFEPDYAHVERIRPGGPPVATRRCALASSASARHRRTRTPTSWARSSPPSTRTP